MYTLAFKKRNLSCIQKYTLAANLLNVYLFDNLMRICSLWEDAVLFVGILFAYHLKLERTDIIITLR